MFAIYSRFKSGHRKEYIDFIKNHFKSYESNAFNAVITKDTSLFLMIEENFALFCFTAFFRAICKKKTAGLLFRPKPALTSKLLKHKVKKIMLKFLKKFRYIGIYTISSHKIFPEYKQISNACIYDFQFYDLDKKFDSSHHSSDIDKYLNTEKKIILSIGFQDSYKQPDKFIKLINDNRLREKYLFVLAGKQPNEIMDIETFKEKGGVVINDYLDESDFNFLLNKSDFLWAYYSSDYDQSSGVAGRAIQLKKQLITRKDSVIDCICAYHAIPTISVNEQDLVHQLISANKVNYESKEITREMKEFSIHALKLFNSDNE